ncbi:MAG: hypothetical protein J1E85_10465 [Ruminococcus sp.]|nr:hypothetical protein [Ruminococcus sp.]
MLSIFEISKLKSEIKSKFNTELHYHDACPKGYFTLDEDNENIVKFIEDFFAERNLQLKFSDDRLHFVAERITNA